ncbi:hypothetical protein [Spiroplasma endosymbiont of Dasysyrphus albostriatus]|uniref:hypothetical protein n=1 Tax=Spiroplasma endosymbiont of Dasysyrphus albostriatus TaxID=3066299 RepID=UPI0030D01FE8
MNDLLINNTSELVTFNTNSTDPTNIKNITWKNSIQEHKNKVEQTYQIFLKSQEWGKKLRQQITTPLTTTKIKNRHKKRSTNILVSTLTTEQIQRLSPKQIKWLTNWQIKELTAEQIQSFTIQQIQSFTKEQIEYFTEEQKEVFWPKQVITKINTMDLQTQSTTSEFKPNLPKM